MDFNAISLPSGKKISVLRVQDLKKELAQRRLSTVGKKAELTERLAKSLLCHGDEEEAMEVDQTLEVEDNPRFVTPDRENTGPEEDPQIRKSTKASRVRPSFQPVDEDPMEDDPFFSDDEEIVAKPPASASRSARRDAPTSRSLTHTVSPAKQPASAPRSALRASRSRTHTISPAKTPAATDHRRVSDVAMRTRSRSPQLAVTTPGNSMAGATTPQRPATGRRTPKSAATLFANPTTDEPRALPPRSAAMSATRSGSRTARRALLQDEKKKKEEVPEVLSHKPPTGRVENRFAASHKKLDEMEETLAERQMRILERHEKMNNSLPDVVKRLNTPKQSGSHVPIRPQNSAAKEGFKFEPLAEKPSLKFGNVKPVDINLVQKDIPSTSTATSRATVKKPQERMDVKAKTKANGAKPKLTVPDDDTFTEYIATPKGKTPAKTPSRVGYTPKTGNLRKFIDTSKLSDRELQLAREEGLIGGGSTAKRVPLIVQNNRKRTEEIVNIRRKLNL